MFKDLIRRMIEVYNNDMLIKSMKAKYRLEYIKLTFEFVEKYQVKLNPTKCTFRVSSSKFLGYLVTQREIIFDH